MLGAVGAMGLLTGCGGSARACPAFAGIPQVRIDAGPWATAHPGSAARMGVCVLTTDADPDADPEDCTAAGAAARAERINPRRPVASLRGLTAGTHRVRVVLVASDGHLVLDTTGRVSVHHTDGGRCHTIVGNVGSATVDAHGRLAPG
ncbi:hypothetical protein [Actinacidiphila yeochonensis]|uniref:hypothetical protein n=1 Tax=Actinacidiphila yeochonensis TaxID=89050 RepID=UPI00056A9F1B|nr:hypothetical protein [Actinacidiphila yeochonensis]